MGDPDRSMRSAIIAAKRCGRHTWQAIGERVGLSWQAARGLYRRHKKKVANPGPCPICYGHGDLHDPEFAAEPGVTFEETGNYAEAKAKGSLIQTLDELLEACAVDPDTWRVWAWGAKQWSIGAKEKHGHLEWTEGKIDGWLRYEGLQTHPLWSVWAKFVRKEPVAIHPVIQPITCDVSYETPPRPTGGLRRALIGSDPQIGFRMERPSKPLVPFHDRAALDLFLQLAAWLQPELIVWLGDILDNAEWTDKFLRDPEFDRMTQPALFEAHWWARQVREACPGARIEFHEGNHDKRIRDYLATHLRAAYELKPADEPEAPSVLDPRRLLGLDRLGIEWVGGYPDDLQWLNEELQMYHGDKASAVPGATARALVDEFDTSVIAGHGHSQESASRVRRVKDVAGPITAYCLGCLCRVDGAVPAARGRVNWQQGVAVVDYDERDHNVSMVRVVDGVAVWDGHRFQARERTEDLRRDIPGWMW